VDGGPGRPPRRRATRSSARVRPGLAGPAYILVSCASVQTAAAIATKVFATFGPAGTGALRFLAAAAVLGGCIRPRVRARPAAFWGLVAGLGMSTAATNLFLYEAIARVPLGTAGTLVFLGPLALAIAATRRRVDIVWAAAAAIGVVLLTGASSDVSVLGVALALVAAASVAASILMARGLGAHAEGLDGLTLAIVAAAILTLPMSATAVVGHASAPALGAFVLVVVVGTLGVAIPYALEFSALRRVGVKTYGILLSLDPAIAGLAGLAFLGQRLDAPEMLGIALVMAASAGAISSATG
jgi:inner membrane transporter RhtA